MTTAKEAPVLLITGAAQRVGACVASHFHERGYRVAIHYRQSREQAEQLAAALCEQRPDSAIALGADLQDIGALQALPGQVLEAFGRLDTLVNNASSFYPTPFGSVDESDWNALLDSNLKGPFFLSQACLPALTQYQGSVINLVDIYAERPLKEHPVYCVAKAGLVMLTKTLALDASPKVRANAIAPGAILWPGEGSAQLSEEDKQALLSRVPLGTRGGPSDLAQTAWFLAQEAPYMTGQILSLDGGRSVVA